MSKLVRYEVLLPVFVNGSLIEPAGKKPTYVEAAPGLEGKALRLVQEDKPQPPTASFNKPLDGPKK